MKTENFVTVEGRTLADAMKSILMVIERRMTIPILSYVKMTVVGSDLTLTGTDLDIEIQTAIDMIDAGGEFSICLPSSILYDIARLAGPAPVKLTIGSRCDTHAGKPHTVHFVSVDVADGDALYSIDSPLPASDFPAMNAGEFSKIESFTNGRLAALLGKVSPCISSEETRYYLNGVCWQYQGGSCRFTSTDGHRLASVNYGSPDDKDAAMSVIIHRKTAHIVQMLGKGKDITVSGAKAEAGDFRFLMFVLGRTVIRSKTIDGSFPDWKRVVPTSNQSVIEFDSERLRAALGRVTAMASERGRAVRIYAEHDGTARLSVRNAEFGEATAKTFAKWPAGSNTTEFGFNARYLKDAIGAGSGPFRLKFADAGSPFLIEDNDDEMTRVLMPMRV